MSWAGFKRFLEAIVLLDKLGLAFGIGGAAALAGAVWAKLSELPHLFVTLAAADAFVVGSLAYAAVRAYLRSRQEPADCIAWGKHEVLRVWDAAHLWVGMEPPDHSVRKPRAKAYPIFRRIKLDVLGGRLHPVGRGASAAEALLSRAELKRYAGMYDEAPIFLEARFDSPLPPPAQRSALVEAHTNRAGRGDGGG